MPPGAWQEGAAGDLAWRARSDRKCHWRAQPIPRLELGDIAADSVAIEWHAPSGKLFIDGGGLWRRPLYFLLRPGRVVVSDSFRSLYRLSPEPLALDVSALDSFLALQFFPPAKSPFREIHKVGLEDVCWIDVERGTFSQTPKRLASRDDRCPLAEAVDATQKSLSSAVQDAFDAGSGQPIVFCSGGLDSSTLVHLLPAPAEAVVLSYPGSWKDESERGRRAAHHAGVPSRIFLAPSFDPREHHEFIEALDEPSGDTAYYSFWQMSRKLPEGLPCISGHGAGMLSLILAAHERLSRWEREFGAAQAIQKSVRRETMMEAPLRRRLLATVGEMPPQDPVEQLLQDEEPAQVSLKNAWLAVIRRQLFTEESVMQFWAIYDRRRQAPIMPYYDPRTRNCLDRLSVSLLRSEQTFERRLLGELLRGMWPGFVPEKRRTGSGLPLAEWFDAVEGGLVAALSPYCQGFLCGKTMRELLLGAEPLRGAERARALQQFWNAMTLQCWLESLGIRR
jgi:hypothetical protein